MNSIMKTEYIATANDSTKIRYVIWSGSSENKKNAYQETGTCSLACDGCRVLGGHCNRAWV